MAFRQMDCVLAVQAPRRSLWRGVQAGRRGGGEAGRQAGGQASRQASLQAGRRVGEQAGGQGGESRGKVAGSHGMEVRQEAAGHGQFS